MKNEIELLEHAAAGRGFSLARLRFSVSDQEGIYQIAIAGSDDLRDWWRNLSTDMVQWPTRHGDGDKGLVHLGFFEGSEVLYRFLWSRTRNRSVRLWGHSLGGSVALLLGRALYEGGREVEHVTVFGAPRVGDADFAQSYPIGVTSYVCGRDPIPLVPRWGRRLNGDTIGSWTSYSHVSEPKKLPSQLGWRSGLPWRWPQDHLLKSYKNALEAIKC